MALRGSIALAVLIVLTGSFLFVRTSDEALPAGVRSALVIWDHGEVEKEETIATLTRAAADHDVSLVKDSLGATSSGAARTLYVVHQSGGRAWPDAWGLYPDFGRDVETRWADVSSLPLAQTNGMYDSDAPQEDLDLVAADLRSLGMEVSTLSGGPLSMMGWALYVVPLPALVGVSLLAVATGVVHAASLRRRRDVVLVVNGSSRRAVAVHDVRESLVLSSGALVAGLVVSLPLLAWYNGLAQWPRFAVLSLLGVSGVAVVSAVVVTAVAVLRAHGPVLSSVDRARPPRLPSVVLGVGHVLVIASVISVTATGVAASGKVLDNRADQEAWSTADDWFRLQFHSGLDESLQSDGPFAELARHEFARQAAMVAVRPAGPSEGYGPYHGDSLTVDARYLEERSIRDAAGRELTASDAELTSLLLLVPDSLGDDVASIEREWVQWLDEELSDHGVDPAYTERVDVAVRYIADRQSVFTYGTDWGDESSHQRDAVVAVLPTAVDVVSDGWLASNMTSGGVLFSDPSSVQRQLDAAGLDQQIGSIDRARDVAMVRIAEQSRELRDVLAVAALALVAALLSATMTGAALAELGRRRDVVLLTAGAGPLRTALLPAASMGAVGVVVIAAAQTLGLVEGPGAVAAAAVVVVADVVVISAVLGVHRSRIRADTLNRP